MPTFPGTHSTLNFSAFDRDEGKIVGFLARSFYLTQASTVMSGNSSYSFALGRPSDQIQNVLNYDREIVILFSSYETFEARTLDCYRQIEERYPFVRVERSIRFVFSRDRDVVEKITRLMDQNPELPIVCPFHYDDYQSISNISNLSESLRKLFFSRDLFNNQNPLRSSRFFFGRSDLLKSIVDRHVSGENSGIFGLRRTGKTSLLNGLARAAKAAKQPYVLVDCQTTSVHLRRWNEVLQETSNRLVREWMVKPPRDLDFSERGAADSFNEVVRIASRKYGARILIAFDEIENISPITSPTDHWRTGTDALLFWQTMRSISQSDPSPLGFVVVGINPKLIENVTLCSFDNPLFKFVSVDYIKGFTADQTHEMCTSLGSIMGLNFEIDASSTLNMHFGGNPFLVRQAGSKIHELTKAQSRPIKVTIGLAEQAADAMERSAAVYATGMLEVLKQFYPDEFELLCWLSAGNSIDFQRYIAQEPLAIDHLEGYGVVESDLGRYSFRVKIFAEAIKQFLRERTDLMSQEQRREFISSERTKIEHALRSALRTIALTKFGKTEAVAKIVGCLTRKRQNDLRQASIEDMFSISTSKLYLSDFFAIIDVLQAEFQNLTGCATTELKSALETVNRTRVDAHANQIEDEELKQFRLGCSTLKDALGT